MIKQNWKKNLDSMSLKNSFFFNKNQSEYFSVQKYRGFEKVLNWCGIDDESSVFGESQFDRSFWSDFEALERVLGSCSLSRVHKFDERFSSRGDRTAKF